MGRPHSDLEFCNSEVLETGVLATPGPIGTRDGKAKGQATMELYLSSSTKAAKTASTKIAASSLADEVRGKARVLVFGGQAGRAPHRSHVVTRHLGRPQGAHRQLPLAGGGPQVLCAACRGTLPPWLCGPSLPLFTIRVGRPRPRKYRYSPTTQCCSLRMCSTTSSHSVLTTK